MGNLADDQRNAMKTNKRKSPSRLIKLLVINKMIFCALVCFAKSGANQNNCTCEQSSNHRALSNMDGKGKSGLTLIEAIAIVESNNNPKAIGDNGKASGAWQMWEVARIDARKILGRDGTDKELATALLGSISKRLEAKLGRKATDQEIYAVWNLGFSGFQKRGFKIENCPRITQNACAKIINLTSK
jgi:hypothetical protein